MCNTPHGLSSITETKVMWFGFTLKTDETEQTVRYKYEAVQPIMLGYVVFHGCKACNFIQLTTQARVCGGR